MSEVLTYRDLSVWQKGMELTRMVYHQSKSMPADERFGLTNQMRRAAVSIPSNIAEGNASGTTAVYLRHLRIARGSLAELQTQYQLATTELRLLNNCQELCELLQETDRMLQGLIRSIEKKLNRH